MNMEGTMKLNATRLARGSRGSTSSQSASLIVLRITIDHRERDDPVSDKIMQGTLKALWLIAAAPLWHFSESNYLRNSW